MQMWELKVYEDSLDGDIVFQRTIKDVTNADSVVVPFELDRSKMNVTPGKDKLILLKLQQKMKFVREITSTYCCYRH